MAKCKYEFSFKIECDEPVQELKIKLVDKKGHTSAMVAPVKQQAVTEPEPEESDDAIDIPPEMMMDF